MASMTASTAARPRRGSSGNGITRGGCPPDADEIVFLGHPAWLSKTETRRSTASGPTGRGLTHSSPCIACPSRRQGWTARGPGPVPGHDVLSDDGPTGPRYANWEPGDRHPTSSAIVHLLDLDTATDRRMTFDPSCRHARASPSSCSVTAGCIFERQDAPGPAWVNSSTAPVRRLGTPVHRIAGLRVRLLSRSVGPLSPDRARPSSANPFEPKDGPAHAHLDIDTGRGPRMAASVHPPQFTSWQRLAP